MEESAVVPENFDKVVRIGTIELMQYRTVKPTDVYIHIVYSDGRLSITGVEGSRKNGDCWGSAGQIAMGYDHRDKSQNSRSSYRNLITVDDITFAPGWDSDLWYGLLNIWHSYHLNDMKATCEHQEIMGWSWSTHSSYECPICGYRLGHAWKRISVPVAVLEFLRYLPETDKTPAWV